MPRESTTEPVKQLVAMVPPPGEILTLEAMEEVTFPLTRRDRRFQTIYRALIRYALKWLNQVLDPVPGVGLRVLHEYERATEVVKTIGRTEPLLKRAKDRADGIQIARLEGLHLDEANYVRRTTHGLYDATCAELHKLATRPRMPEPTPPSPRRAGIAPGETRSVPKAS